MTYIGFAPYEPQPENVDLIENVQHVLLEYQEYLPLTLRQIFYRLVGSRGYDKTETAYKRLGNVLARARRARLIRFNAIRDDGLTVNSPASFSGAGDFIQAVMHSARRYRRDRQEGQRTRIIVACEASGMVPQLVRVCEPYGISVRSSGGFDSVTAKHDLATDIVDRLVDTKLFHVGDYDPSGVHLYLNLEADVGRFVRELSIQEYDDAGAVSFSVQRVAVTPEQVLEYSLPTAPAKATDRRKFYGIGDDHTATAQAEALPPDLLASILKKEIEASLDGDALHESIQKERQEREQIIARLGTIPE